MSVCNQARWVWGSSLPEVESYIDQYRTSRSPTSGQNCSSKRGMALLGKFDLHGALQDMDEATRLNPDDADIYDCRGHARFVNGDIEGALQDLDEVIRLNPDDAGAFIQRSDVRRAKGDVEGALRDYSEAFRLGYKPEK